MFSKSCIHWLCLFMLWAATEGLFAPLFLCSGGLSVWGGGMRRAADSLMLGPLSAPLRPQSIRTPTDNDDREKQERCKAAACVHFRPGERERSSRGRASCWQIHFYVTKDQNAKCSSLWMLQVTGCWGQLRGDGFICAALLKRRDTKRFFKTTSPN